MTKNRSPRNKTQPQTTKAGQAASLSLSQAVFQVTSGPIPPPETLEHYEKVLPGAAKIIMEMAQNQAAHRQELEKVVTKGGSRDSLLGIIVGGLIGLAGLGGSAYALLNGVGWPATSLGGCSLVSLVSVFVYGTSSRRKERQQKMGIIQQQQKEK